MKKITILFIVFSIGMTKAQITKQDIKNFYESDNAKGLKKLITNENKNNCIELGNSEYTLLAIAIRTNNIKIFNMLLDNKVDLEKACSSKSPLMYTAKYGNIKMAEQLLKAGAKINTKNYKGRTAFDYAKKYKQKELYEFLKNYK